MPVDATTCPHRDAEFVVNVHARRDHAPDDMPCASWARNALDRAGRDATGGVYVDFVTGDEQRVQAAYGGNYERPRESKRR